eukprot:TRINITY_DN473_c2_g1_i1.p1 TRINITY_DN473_c2_g1~~TRINITY_DN473_c2_g1_i1.p1  ORF type:complete len:477 (+),score=154.15 TRINITY_DN473_c2_g1_i1:80-1432(+)
MEPQRLFYALLLVACMCSALPPACALTPEIFRVSPDPFTVSKSGSIVLSAEFNQPMSEGESGNITITRLTQPPLIVFSQSIHSPYVTISYATVNIAPPEPIAASPQPYQVRIPRAAFVASSTGEEFAGENVQWVFYVDATGPVLYNSSVPSALSHESTVNPLLAEISPDNLRSTIAHLSESYPNRFFQSKNGLLAALYVREQYNAIAEHANMNGGNWDVNIQFFAHRWLVPSIIVRVQGRGKASEEVVVLGAHLDSINRQNWTTNVKTGTAPGADDDASGVALGLELFRVLLSSNVVLDRSVEFHVYAAEEEGLYGSSDLAAMYQRAKKKVAGMLQLDQCGYVRDPDNERIALFVDNTDPVLNNFTMQAVSTYQPLPCILSDENGRADSDFHSWTRNGFRASYIAEGPVDDIVYGNDKHTAWDTIDGVSISHVVNIGRAAFGFILELALD